MGSGRVRFALLALFVIQAAAEKCKPSTCFSKIQAPLFDGKAGQQFMYDFESTATAQLVNKDTAETSVAIKGQAIVTVGENCGYSLQLKNVFAFGSDNNKLNVQKDFELPVQFTLSGDELSPELCAEANDGTFSLNVKRGVISAFQNGAGRSSELDIFGKCPVSSSSSNDGKVTTITSTRDLDQCAYREKLNNGLIQGVVTESSEIKSSPILNGKVESEAKYSNGALQSIELKENYNFLPFSTQAHGAKAKVVTKLNLKKTGNGQPVAQKTQVLRSLLFENANTAMNNPKVKVRDSIKAAFGKTLQEFTGQEGVISAKSAATFAEIIRLMRLAKKADLLTSYQEMKKNTLSDLQKSASMKQVSRSIFLDALFRTGTGDSVAALADLAKKELSEKEQQLMYLSFNLVQSVNKDAITALSKLFSENLPKEAYLSIGSVINKYCRDRGCEAGDVKIIADKFVSKIPKDCKTSNKKDEEALVAVLKGIRNSQTILNSALDRIIQCANNRNPNRIRVVALQAFTANPCNKKLQQAAVTILKNRDEDSEVRIEAYLAAVECPSGALANDIQALLNTEPINQVGSFINTHLDSTKASTDPKRESARAHFKNLRTSKKYPFDPRRYSFNREVSYAIDAFGLGSAVDSSVIYSQQSFLPRSLRLNVTGNLFGSAFNMFELSARQENLESLVEHYFGPQGLFSKMTKQQLYDAVRNEFMQISRSKRALPGDLAAFDKNVKLSNEYNREPDLDLSMKVFGSELYFLSMSQNIPATPSEFLKLIANELHKGVDALKNFQYNFENHALWMDGEIVYPTALGLPFKLSSVGASAVKVDLSGSIDIKSILENPFDSKAQVTFSPAANIYIAGQMGFSAYAYESALEVAGTFYTNSGANTTVEVQNGKNFVVTSVPTVKEQYVVDLTHEVSTVSQESGREVVKVPVKFRRSDREALLCFDQVEFLTGFTFCTYVDLMPMNISQHAHWPLYGQNHVYVKLDMVDAINFKAEFDDKDPGRPGINFYYDTPSGGKQRQTSLKLLSSFNPDHFMGGFDVSVPIQAESPFKINAAIGFVNKENEKKFYLDGSYLGGAFTYEIGFRRKGNQIEPVLKLNTDLAYVSGKITETKTPNGVKYDLKQVKFGADKKETLVDGSIEVSGSKLVSNLKFAQGGNTVNFVGSLGLENGQLDGDLKISSPQIAMANGNLNYKGKLSDGEVQNDLTVVYDKDPNTKVNRFAVSQLADWKDKELFKTKNSLEVGVFNAAGRFNGEFGKKIMNVDSGLDYNKQKAEFKLDNKYSQKQPHDYETSVFAAANEKSIKIDMKRDIVGESSKITNKLELSNGLKLEVNGKVAHQFDCKNGDVSLQGVFVPGPKRDQTKVTVIIKNTEREHSANSKITIGKNEFANFESKLSYGNNMVGTLKASAANAVTLDGSFQSNDGKGNAVINASIKERKLKADSQFNIQKPTYDFSTDIFYDYEKDNTKKVFFSTKNQVQDSSLVSKNEVEVFGEHYAFNVDAKNDGTFTNGKQTGSGEVVLPTGRKFLLSGEREVRLNKDGNGHGNLHVTATDELPNKQQRQAIVDVKVNDMSPRAGFFDMGGSLKYRTYDNKDLKVQVTALNQKKGHYSTASGSLQVDGSLVPDVTAIKFNIDEYCPDHAIYSGSAKYGQVGDIAVDGKFYVGNKDRPHSHDFNGVLNLPQTSLKKLTVSSNGQLTEPVDPESPYVVKYAGTVDIGGKKAHVETDLKMSSTKGSGSAKLELPETKPISGEIVFNCNHKDKADGSLSVVYGDNKKFKTSGNLQLEGEKNLSGELSVSGDLETFKDIKLRFNAKQPSEKEISAKLNLQADSQQYSLDYDHRLSTRDPRFSVVLVRPQGTSKFLAEAQLESQFKGKGNLAVENFESFNLVADVDGDVSTVENFYLKGGVDSELIGLKKFTFDVKSKDGGAGRAGFDFKFTKEGKHLFSGSSDFTTKMDKGRTVIEGKSTIKLTDGKSDEVSFKIIRNLYEAPRDGETGFGGVVTLIVGPRNFAGEMKLTDKEVHAKYTGCEAKNRCTNLEARSALEKSSLEGFKHNMILTIDLREVGFSHEFGLKADTSREGWKFNHAVDAYLQSKDKPEYQYSVFIKPNEAGALLSLPRRQVALDATYKYPQQTPFGAYDSTISFYIDKKNNPRLKTEIGFNGQLNQDSKNLITGRAELNFVHPRVKKLRVGGEFSANPDSMDAKSKIEFDVFSKPLDMIVVSANFGNSDNSGRGFNISNDVEIYSKGLGINMKYHEHAGLSFDQRLIAIGSELTLPIDDFRFGLNAFLNEKSAEVVVVGFGQQILKSASTYDVKKQDINMETTIQYLGSEPVVQKSSITGLTQGSFTMSKGRLFNVDSGFAIGKDIHLIVTGSEKEVFNGKIALNQGHFLESNYKVDDTQFKAFTNQLQEQIKRDLQTADANVKDKFNKLQNFWTDKLEKVSRASPDFSQFQQEYEQELNKLVEELKQDPAIKKIIDQIAGIVGELAKAFSQISAAVGEQFATVEKAVKEYYEQAVKAFNENILPEIKKLYESLQQLLSEVYEQSVKLLTAAFERVTKALKTFEEDFNKISKAIKEATGDTYEAIGEFVKSIINEFKGLCDTLKEQFSNLPGVDFVKEKYNEIFGEINLIDTVKSVVLELIGAIAEVVPDQAKPLFNKFSDYLNKKLAGEQVDDIAILKDLYKSLIEAISGFKTQYVDGISTDSLTSAVNLDIFKRLPPFISNIRLSAFNQLRSEPIFNFRDLIYLYRPYAFNPAELLPPFTLHGEISDGSHIFTFDGRYLTFPGKCSYILARDFVGGNFSIVATMNNGKLKSISLVDKSGHIEVNSDGLLKAGEKNSEYPYHVSSLHAWRDYYTVSVLSEYGAEVQCSDDLITCHVRVSGFYSGKTRGLLGNGNNEPYDDYLLPNGKITESTSELGNAYRTRQDCAAVTESGDQHPKSHSNEFCAQFFGRDSPLRLGYLFVNPTNFREACEHATHGSADAQKEACNIAATYASRLRQEHIPVSLPKACKTCTYEGKALAVGDEVSVKVPQKQADIVVVFDTALGKDQSIVQEILIEVKRELKNNGIPDIQVAAIGYNENDKYFYQYTSNGKLDFKGNFATLKSTGPKEEDTLVTENADVDAALKQLEKSNNDARHDLGVSPDARAFYAATKYPFRPTATKTIIAFRSNEVPYSPNPSKLIAAEVSGRVTLENGISVHAVMPVTITEPADRAKNIVGFNNNVALLLNEKKRPNMGSVEIAGKLKYESDMGVDLTRKNGYIFNLKAYQTDKKKFVGVAGYVIADVISRTEVKSDCKCTLDSGLYPVTRCKATEQKLLAPSTKKSAKGR